MLKLLKWMLNFSACKIVFQVNMLFEATAMIHSLRKIQIRLLRFEYRILAYVFHFISLNEV